jgi:hypothetical protein
MALVIIKGHVYYTRSIRIGKRVTSVSLGCGSGRQALLAAELDEEDRALREAERAAARASREAEYRAAVRARQDVRERLRADRERLRETDRALAGYHRHVARTVEGVLGRMGYHRHHGAEWRRRRSMGVELVTLRAQDLDRIVLEADRDELKRLGSAAHRQLYELASAGEGYLEQKVEWMLCQTLSPGDGALHKEGVMARLAILRMELVGPAPTLPERLLADRVAMHWLCIHLLEISRADLLNQQPADPSKGDLSKGEAMDRWLSRAEARYVRALVALAKVQRLKLPPVVAVVRPVPSRSIDPPSARSDVS